MKNIIHCLKFLTVLLTATFALSFTSHAQSSTVLSQEFRDALMSMCIQDNTATNFCECTLDEMQNNGTPDEIFAINSGDTSFDKSRLSELIRQANTICAKKLSGNLSSQIQPIPGIDPGVIQLANTICKSVEDSTGGGGLCACAVTTSAVNLSPDEKNSLNSLYASKSDRAVREYLFSLYEKSYDACVGMSQYK